MLAAATAMRLADFGDFIPFLFIIYVIYAIFSSMAKAVKQAAKVQQAASTTDTSSQQPLTAADVRLALQRRLTAAAAARSQAAAAQAAANAPSVALSVPAVAAVSASSTQPDFGAAAGAQQMQIASDGSMTLAPSGMNFSTLLATLPAAAQAIVASAVIGPCAAHRGGGHNPEDW